MSTVVTKKKGGRPRKGSRPPASSLLTTSKRKTRKTHPLSELIGKKIKDISVLEGDELGQQRLFYVIELISGEEMVIASSESTILLMFKDEFREWLETSENEGITIHNNSFLD